MFPKLIKNKLLTWKTYSSNECPMLKAAAIFLRVSSVSPVWTSTKKDLTEPSSCCSMLTPPRSLQMITIPPLVLSRVIAK